MTSLLTLSDNRDSIIISKSDSDYMYMQFNNKIFSYKEDECYFIKNDELIFKKGGYYRVSIVFNTESRGSLGILKLCMELNGSVMRNCSRKFHITNENKNYNDGFSGTLAVIDNTILKIGFNYNGLGKILFRTTHAEDALLIQLESIAFKNE